VPWLKWLFDAWRLPVGSHATLDIGCSYGWMAAAMSVAGAATSIGTDIRRPNHDAFRSTFPASTAVLAMADMFKWCYAPDRFAFISIRNNSAFCMAPQLDEKFVELGRNVRRSLTQGGLAYLSFLTNFSGMRSDDGFTNLPLADIIDYLHRTGLHIVKMMKLGGATAFLLCRPEDAAHFDGLQRTITHGQRFHALREYVEARVDGAVPAPRILRNLFLAAADMASEIALRWHICERATVCLFGRGILTYYVWRIMTVLYPHIPVGGFVVETNDEPSVLHVVTDEEAGRIWGDNVLSIYLDTKHWVDVALGAATSSAPPCDLMFTSGDFGPTLPSGEPSMHGVPTSGETFTFHYCSGDHDVEVPPIIAGAYLTGLLRNLQEPCHEDAAAFEERFFTTFPSGFEGV